MLSSVWGFSEGVEKFGRFDPCSHVFHMEDNKELL